MKTIVLSGANTIVLSGASLSCYQAHASVWKPRHASIYASRNLSNLEFFELLSNLKPSPRAVNKVVPTRHQP